MENERTNTLEGLKKSGSAVKKLFLENAFGNEETEQEKMLRSLYKGAMAGMSGVEIIKPYIKNRSFRNLVYKHYGAYTELAKDIKTYAAQNNIEVDGVNGFEKAMMTVTTFFTSIADRSTSRLAEMMVKGVNSAIVDCIKMINSFESSGLDVSYVKKALEIYESQLDELKAYL